MLSSFNLLLRFKSLLVMRASLRRSDLPEIYREDEVEMKIGVSAKETGSNAPKGREKLLLLASE